jgi:hypothetical protein
MSWPSLLPPGGGFVALAGGLVAAVAFFAWGLRPPPLEEVWRIQTELEVGTRGTLTDRELALFQDVLRRHPETAESLLAGAPHGLISASHSGRVEIGYAYLLRHRADRPVILRVTPCVAQRQPHTTEVHARVRSESASGVANADKPFEWSPPEDGPLPQLIEVRVSGEPPLPVSVELVERR